jgi:hypothetical protein
MPEPQVSLQDSGQQPQITFEEGQPQVEYQMEDPQIEVLRAEGQPRS